MITKLKIITYLYGQPNTNKQRNDITLNKIIIVSEIKDVNLFMKK